MGPSWESLASDPCKSFVSDRWKPCLNAAATLGHSGEYQSLRLLGRVPVCLGFCEWRSGSWIDLIFSRWVWRWMWYVHNRASCVHVFFSMWIAACFTIFIFLMVFMVSPGRSCYSSLAWKYWNSNSPLGRYPKKGSVSWPAIYKRHSFTLWLCVTLTCASALVNLLASCYHLPTPE